VKKRILFVDDEPQELENLQHMLAGMEAEWDMEFVRGSTEALALMAKGPFDVLLADWSLPGMTGIQLLEEASKRYPGTVRFLLSSFADNDLIMKCVWGTHQYLSKRCDAATLKFTVRRMLVNNSWLANVRLKDLVSRMRTFPTLPSLYFEVVKELESPQASAERVGEIIGKDLAMTAKILQTSNSAFFGLSRTITAPTEAVLLLGMETVKSLVLSIHAYSQLDKVKPLYFSTDKVWRHSQRVGALAKRIAQLENADQTIVDEAFTAGLFHDLGKLLMATNLPNEYSGAQGLALKKKIPLWEVERELFGATHAETGAYLLGLWGLSIPLVEAVALHHAPGRSDTNSFSPITAVHVANALDYQQTSEHEGFVPPELDIAYLDELGLRERLPEWLNGKPENPNQQSPRPISETPDQTPSIGPVRVGEMSASSSSNLQPFWIGASICAVIAVILSLAVWFVIKSDLPKAQNEVKNRPTAAAQRTTLPTANVSQPPAGSLDSSNAKKPENTAPPPDSTDPTRTNAVIPAIPAPELRLQGIFYRRSNASALINGKTVFRGDSIAGGRVVAIDPQSVTVELAGEQKLLRLR
jgi:HD-like signal output (HDOD) protein/ActR/RegA family two-component response regulator